MNRPSSPNGMLPAGCFQGKTIAVSGGGSGLGKSMGRYLLELGARLTICGRREQVLRQTAAELEQETGGKVFPFCCDVRDADKVEGWFAAAEQHAGPVDGLVNNAAGNFICPTERLSHNAFSSVVDIVLKGTFYCTLAAAKRWIAGNRPGAVLNIVTTYAWTGSGYVVPSSAAKAGVWNLTRSLAAEWGRHGIRVNAVAPGPFPTEGAWSRLFPPQVQEKFDPKKTIPAGRLGEHRELADLAAYLLSDYAGYINGECVTIDGGQWLQAAGQFNFLNELNDEEWDALQAATKPKKTPQ